MSRKWKIIIGVTIAVIAIGGGLYYYFEVYKKKTTVPTQTPASPKVPTLTPLQQAAVVRPAAVTS